MAKKATDDRKARLAELRKAQQAAERRRTLLVAGAAGAVVIGLVATVTVVIRNELAGRDVTAIGVAATQAACDPVITDKASGSNVHVGPGTDQADKITVSYATVPPSSGEHYAVPETPNRPFYSASDRPRIETLVHNLEHGYTVVWYDDALPQDQKDQLRRIAELARDDENTAGKFIASAWDTAYGELPDGKPVAISHWGAKNGFRQLCGGVSGEVVQQFIEKYPYRDSPEPNAA